MPMKCYRADRLDVSIGTVITSPGDHISTLNGGLLDAENKLRAASPLLLVARSTGLFVFTNYEWVFKYAALQRRYLYELSVDDDDILHSADMMIVNDIGLSSDDKITADLINQYIGRAERSGDRVEYMVTQATVLACHATPKDAATNLHNIYQPKSSP